ncbi:CPBP family intramembrane metalloprotease [candidate division KSB1 bacterium]|nr:CPBP family intramembrane metalloprotease [candidate division KSB1 bacterium]
MSISGLPSIICWFITGLFVFVPLFIFALTAYRVEGGEWSLKQFSQRFRLRTMNKKDWYWTLISIVIVFILTGFIMWAAEWLYRLTGRFGPINTSPSFFQYHGIEDGRYWILLAWLPMFVFNIFGEELLWRGYILPRQELAFYKYAWLVNFACWLLFHICFGFGMMVMLLPILLIVPFVVQKRKNTWIGILIHGIVNGLGFITISLKLI